MDKGPSSSSGGKTGVSMSFRFNNVANDGGNLEELFLKPPSISPQPPVQPTEDSNWRRDFLQGSFFNRKRSGSIEGNSSGLIGNVSDSGGTTTAWNRIKGKVNQAMEDIKSNNQKEPFTKVDISHQINNGPTNGNESDLETATIHSSFSDDFLDPLPSTNFETGPRMPIVDNNSDSDNDVDSEIFNADDTTSILRKSFQNLKTKSKLEKESIKAILKPSKASPKESSPIKTIFLRKRKGEENKDKEQKTGNQKKDIEIESGVEMLEDMVISHETEQAVTSSLKSPLPEQDKIYSINVPNITSLGKQRPTELTTAPDHSHLIAALITFLQSRHFVVSLLLVSILYLARIPPFIQGVIACLMAIFLFNAIYDAACSLVKAIIARNNPHPEDSKFAVPDYKKMPICEIPEEHKSLKIYAGWMNEINSYDPNNCHIAMTKTVYVKLDGNRLKVANVANRVSKRAIWNETVVDKKSMIVTRNRVFNLLGCRVEMCPKGLARKRYFNRKYPILLIIPNPGTASSDSSIITPEREDNPLLTMSAKKDFQKQDSLDSPEFPEQFQDVDNDFGMTIVNSDLSTLQDHQPDNDMVPSQKDATPCGDETRLLLFARTDREKEDWYRRFLAASIGAVTDSETHIPNVHLLSEEEVATIRQSGFLWDGPPVDEEKVKPIPDQTDRENSEDSNFEGLLMTPCSSRGPTNYVKFMSKYQQAGVAPKPQPVVILSTPDKKSRREKKEDDLWKGIDQSLFLGPATNVVWANVLVGRVLYSCLNDAVLQEKIQDFLQKKLSAVKLPNFMEDVNIAQICLGDQPPLIHRISQPLLDERGTWIDADVTYEGLIHATVTTKLNLLRLKRQQQQQQSFSSLENPNLGGHRPAKSPINTSLAMSSIYDSDAESTGGSSSESESPTHTTAEIPPDSQAFYNTPSSSRKILRIVDRITASNLFQSATEISYVQRAMENMSTKITLRVELKGLVSRVTVNLPPPPSDRVWIGFRGPPRLWISAKPALGDHSVDWSIVTNVIENKLCEEVYKYLVFPNMVDVIAPFLGASTYKE